MDFSVTPMSTDVARRLRQEIATGARPGRRVTVDEAGAPCRHCLRPAAAGDELLLFTYQPFTGSGPYAVPSPVYLHARDCERYATRGELPELVRTGLRAVRSYDADHDLVDGDVAEGDDLEPLVNRLFEDPRATYLHVHSATAGCFTCRIDRVRLAAAV
jgi:hypothetical protein